MRLGCSLRPSHAGDREVRGMEWWVVFAANMQAIIAMRWVWVAPLGALAGTAWEKNLMPHSYGKSRDSRCLNTPWHASHIE